MKKLTYVIMLLIFATSVIAQNTIKVCIEAGPGCDYTSIQEAIDNAQDGDIILVGPGYYEIDANEGRRFSGSNAGLKAGIVFGAYNAGNPLVEVETYAKDLTLRSTHGRQQTVIDVTGNNDAVGMRKGAGKVTIDGFTFIGFRDRGITDVSYSGSFFPGNGISHVQILNNAIINGSGELLVSNGNTIQITSDYALVKGNVFLGANLASADWSGSGIMLQNASNCIVEDNVVSESDLGIVVAAVA